MATAKLADVKVVLFAPLRFTSRRKATQNAQVACALARQHFGSKATPATWTRLVAASRKLHALVNAERKSAEAREALPLEGPGK